MTAASTFEAAPPVIVATVSELSQTMLKPLGIMMRISSAAVMEAGKASVTVIGLMAVGGSLTANV